MPRNCTSGIFLRPEPGGLSVARESARGATVRGSGEMAIAIPPGEGLEKKSRLRGTREVARFVTLWTPTGRNAGPIEAEKPENPPVFAKN